ncbi:DUF2263 domain-containing protein [Mycena indigotica]|uniref:DUF2263 domain-containing protein n=1 Tax=Mycena indigotica TaxID=2126181 RepID=A0A8H6S5R4_9AGAR|nr:DUF2263 domain-containing protein [Mycena indigotica]KAF7292725.1 DUF2263 domain-containing protein [Mycena indigotica]
MSSRTLNEVAPTFVSRPRDELKVIARATLAAVEQGFYTDSESARHPFVDLSSEANSTTCYDKDSFVDWRSVIKRRSVPTECLIYQASTLQAIRQKHADLPTSSRLAILNFASATSPGGGFLGGARAQEETLARSSNLYSSLSSPIAAPFYSAHNTKSDPRFSHAMVFTRNVRFTRDDAGNWLPPVDVDVLTSAAVNVNALRKSLHLPAERPLPADQDTEVESIMRERMTRILAAFAHNGAEDIVLGSFGTGAFRNRVDFVAKTWAELLAGPFQDVFRCVVFAVIDQGSWRMFKDVFTQIGVHFTEEVAEPI